MGDSLSAGYGIDAAAGWVSLLQQRLRAEGYGYRVINASVSGETTTGGLSRLPRALQVHKPKLVIVELGANDGLRGLPIATSRSNLDSLISRTYKFDEINEGFRLMMAGGVARGVIAF